MIMHLAFRTRFIEVGVTQISAKEVMFKKSNIYIAKKKIKEYVCSVIA